MPLTIGQLNRQAINLLNKAFKQELRDQGHYNTGALEGSIIGTVYPIPGGYQLKGTAYGYAGILNNGVEAGRVPFRLGSGAKTSRFIDALTLYFKQKGLSDKDAKSAAFATAIKMKKQGSPTSGSYNPAKAGKYQTSSGGGSYQYSKNGYRTRFIELVAASVRPQMDELIREGMHEVVRTLFHKTKSERI